METNQIPSRKLRKCLTLGLFLVFLAIAVAGRRKEKPMRHERRSMPVANLPTPLLRASCGRTLHPSICYSTLATAPATSRTEIIEAAINRTSESVADSLSKISRLLSREDLNRRHRGVLSDCVQMLEQTHCELRDAVGDLRIRRTAAAVHRRYEDLKILLSAAMTNQNSCLEGFSGQGPGNRLKKYVTNRLIPIARMVSNSLAMVRAIEAEAPPGEIGERSPDLWGATALMMVEFKGVAPDIVVAGDGSGDCRTVAEAVEKAPCGGGRMFVIRVKRGLYLENVEIPRNKTNIMLIGDGKDSTIIAGNRSVPDGYTTFNSATLGVSGDGFMARDLSVVNTAGPLKKQAVALRVNANRVAFYRCNIGGYQDTLYAHSLRQFYRECSISGTVDFIFGNAAAVFQNCEILARMPVAGQSNMITAQGRDDPNQNTGFSIHNCTIDASPDLAEAGGGRFSTYLGRPWRNYSRTVVMKSFLGEVVHPRGWQAWNRFSNLESVLYIEFMNRGPGSSVRNRVGWGGYKRNFTQEEAMQFTVGELIEGDRWLGFSGFPFSFGL